MRSDYKLHLASSVILCTLGLFCLQDERTTSVLSAPSPRKSLSRMDFESSGPNDLLDDVMSSVASGNNKRGAKFPTVKKVLEPDYGDGGADGDDVDEKQKTTTTTTTTTTTGKPKKRSRSGENNDDDDDDELVDPLGESRSSDLGVATEVSDSEKADEFDGEASGGGGGGSGGSSAAKAGSRSAYELAEMTNAESPTVVLTIRGDKRHTTRAPTTAVPGAPSASSTLAPSIIMASNGSNYVAADGTIAPATSPAGRAAIDLNGDDEMRKHINDLLDGGLKFDGGSSSITKIEESITSKQVSDTTTVEISTGTFESQTGKLTIQETITTKSPSPATAPQPPPPPPPQTTTLTKTTPKSTTTTRKPTGGSKGTSKPVNKPKTSTKMPSGTKTTPKPASGGPSTSKKPKTKKLKASKKPGSAPAKTKTTTAPAATSTTITTVASKALSTSTKRPAKVASSSAKPATSTRAPTGPPTTGGKSTTKTPTGTGAMTTKGAKTTAKAKSASKTTTTAILKPGSSSSSSEKPATTKKPTGTKRPGATKKAAASASPSAPKSAKPTVGPAGGKQKSCTLKDYKELKETDKLLAVVITKRGGFKGRRLNAKAIELIMRSKLAGASAAQKAPKAIQVSSNNTFVFPAGTYYFPNAVRVAGFMSP